jgi:hypothetical protein
MRGEHYIHWFMHVVSCMLILRFVISYENEYVRHLICITQKRYKPLQMVYISMKIPTYCGSQSIIFFFVNRKTRKNKKKNTFFSHHPHPSKRRLYYTKTKDNKIDNFFDEGRILVSLVFARVRQGALKQRAERHGVSRAGQSTVRCPNELERQRCVAWRAPLGHQRAAVDQEGHFVARRGGAHPRPVRRPVPRAGLQVECAGPHGARQVAPRSRVHDHHLGRSAWRQHGSLFGRANRWQARRRSLSAHAAHQSFGRANRWQARRRSLSAHAAHQSFGPRLRYHRSLAHASAP